MVAILETITPSQLRLEPFHIRGKEGEREEEERICERGRARHQIPNTECLNGELIKIPRSKTYFFSPGRG